MSDTNRVSLEDIAIALDHWAIVLSGQAAGKIEQAASLVTEVANSEAVKPHAKGFVDGDEAPSLLGYKPAEP